MTKVLYLGAGLNAKDDWVLLVDLDLQANLTLSNVGDACERSVAAEVLGSSLPSLVYKQAGDDGEFKSFKISR